MSLAVVCGETKSAIDHARALFAVVPPNPAPQQAAVSLTNGVDGVIQGAALMATQSGAAVAQHQELADRRATELVSGALADDALGAHLDAAAAVEGDGANQLDAIAASAQQTFAAAAVATTPAEQRGVLRALRSHLVRTQGIIDDTKRQAAELASGTQALDYHHDSDTHGGTVQPVDFVTGPLPQDPAPPIPTPPPPPVTGEPIKVTPRPNPPTVTVIDASPPDTSPSDRGVGLPKCDTIQQLKYFGEILAGGTLFGASIPADLATLGLVGTAGLIGGAWMVGDGVDNLRRCK